MQFVHDRLDPYRDSIRIKKLGRPNHQVHENPDRKGGLGYDYENDYDNDNGSSEN